MLETAQADLTSLRIDTNQRGNGHQRARRKLPVTLIIVIALIIGVAVAGWLFWRNSSLGAIPVEMVAAAERSPSEEQSILTASGYVVAQRKADVGSKATGLMEELLVREGDAVKANQVIARLQADDTRAMVAEAEATLTFHQAEFAEAQNNLERQRRLMAVRSVAAAELERSETNLNKVVASIAVAQARLEGAKVALENTTIRAPFDGTVLTKNADVGEIVTPMAAGAGARAAVVTIADLSSLQVEADVSESNLEKIKLNAPCEVRLDAYPARSYAGYVASIIPIADRSKGTVLVKIAFRSYDERVLPEMSAKVVFLKENGTEVAEVRRLALTVPETAVATRNGRQIVFTVKNNRAVELPVQTGARFGGFIEVTDGLRAGESVIRNVTPDITGGKRVKFDSD